MLPLQAGILSAEHIVHGELQIITTAAENDRPLLTYCRLGKDRTGLMTALVLSTCGATQSEIVSDYCRYEIVSGPCRSLVTCNK